MLWKRYPLIFGASQMDLLEEFLSLPAAKQGNCNYPQNNTFEVSLYNIFL